VKARKEASRSTLVRKPSSARAATRGVRRLKRRDIKVVLTLSFLPRCSRRRGVTLKPTQKPTAGRGGEVAPLRKLNGEA